VTVDVGFSLKNDITKIKTSLLNPLSADVHKNAIYFLNMAID